jgi:cytoskeletal protein CcmA (bactofilin family)
MIGKKHLEEMAISEGVNALIGRKASFEGKIRFEGMLRIDGKYRGDIVAGDYLVVGETGEVNAKIKVNALTVYGKVKGRVTAKKRILIYPPGQILGDIQTPVLAVSEGAIFEGNCQMEKREIRLDERLSPPKTDEKDQKELERS